jgi:hypothetical protein
VDPVPNGAEIELQFAIIKPLIEVGSGAFQPHVFRRPPGAAYARQEVDPTDVGKD